MEDYWCHIIKYNYIPLRLVCKKWNKFILTFPIKAKQYIPKEYMYFLNITHLTLTSDDLTNKELRLMCSKLTSLDLSYNENIRNIESFTNLTNLDLRYNELITTIPISVTSLNLENNYTIANDELKKLPNLTNLSLHVNNNISDVSFLTNLTSLDLSGNESISLDNIKHLNLRKLKLEYFSQIENISSFVNLTSLDLSYNSNEFNLECLTNLKKLYAMDCNIPNLHKLTKLEKLLIGENVRDIDIKPLTNITHLIIHDGNITIDGLNLDTLVELKISNIRDNKLIRQLDESDLSFHKSFNEDMLLIIFD